MQNKDVCCEKETRPRCQGTGSGLLIVVVLYILLAILFSSFARC